MGPNPKLCWNGQASGPTLYPVQLKRLLEPPWGKSLPVGRWPTKWVSTHHLRNTGLACVLPWLCVHVAVVGFSPLSSNLHHCISAMPKAREPAPPSPMQDCSILAKAADYTELWSKQGKKKKHCKKKARKQDMSLRASATINLESLWRSRLQKLSGNKIAGCSNVFLRYKKRRYQKPLLMMEK